MPVWRGCCGCTFCGPELSSLSVHGDGSSRGIGTGLMLLTLYDVLHSVLRTSRPLGRAPARRRTFCPSQQKVSKKWLPLRGAMWSRRVEDSTTAEPIGHAAGFLELFLMRERLLEMTDVPLARWASRCCWVKSSSNIHSNTGFRCALTRSDAVEKILLPAVANRLRWQMERPKMRRSTFAATSRKAISSSRQCVGARQAISLDTFFGALQRKYPGCRPGPANLKLR